MIHFGHHLSRASFHTSDLRLDRQNLRNMNFDFRFHYKSFETQILYVFSVVFLRIGKIIFDYEISIDSANLPYETYQFQNFVLVYELDYRVHFHV